MSSCDETCGGQVIELGQSASDFPAFPCFLLSVQLKIFNINKIASKMALEAKGQ